VRRVIRSTIGAGRAGFRAGDALMVSGTCREHIVIWAEVAGITLDSQGKAAIHGADPGADTVFISGKNITIKGFTLAGGRDGVDLSRRAAASIDRIVDDTIRNNRGVCSNRLSHPAPVPALRPDTIRNNQGHGIHVGRASSPRIIGNTIADNKGNGIVVRRHSQADIAGMPSAENSGEAVSVSHTSGVNLRTEAYSATRGPHQTDPALKNSDGPFGTLAGSQD